LAQGALWAALTLRADNPNVRPWTTDVAVPLSRLADCIEQTQRDLRASFLPAPIVGHVGDGNFHVVMLVDPNVDAELREAKRLNSLMVSSLPIT
jgi:D-lactate dehydrogenase (cytochrome)